MTENLLQTRITHWIQSELSARCDTTLIMLSGPQGIGKTTALGGIRDLKECGTLILGLDDFYLTKPERDAASQQIHPLCATRGPPGSHDLDLLNEKLDELCNSDSAAGVRLPRFDKRTDDRLPVTEWRRVAARPQLIVLEGWLIGALPDANAASAVPINALERNEDEAGEWRAWQEQHLGDAYAELWNQCHSFLYLDTPDFEVVPEWRGQQEETTLGLAPGSLPESRRLWIRRFVQHYERISRRLLAGDRRPGASIRVGRNRELIE